MEIITMRSRQFFLNVSLLKPIDITPQGTGNSFLKMKCSGTKQMASTNINNPVYRYHLLVVLLTSSCGPITSSCDQETEGLFQLLPVPGLLS
jgi:hypothetical protein